MAHKNQLIEAQGVEVVFGGARKTHNRRLYPSVGRDWRT